MAFTPRRRLRITTQVEFVVPVNMGFGFPGKEFQDALDYAATEWEKDHPGERIYDDSLTIFPADDEIVIRYTIPNEPERPADDTPFEV